MTTNTAKSNTNVWLGIGALVLLALAMRSCEEKSTQQHQFRSNAPTAGEQVEQLRREGAAEDARTEALKAADAVERGDAAGAVAHERYRAYTTERANRD